MKNTLIALLALSGVACGATTIVGDYAGDFSWSASSSPQFTFEDDNAPLSITLATTESYKSTSYQSGTFTPNSNVGNGDDWTLTFTITNTSDDVDLVLGGISLDIFSHNGDGIAQTASAPRAIVISLSGDLEGDTAKVITPGDPGYTSSLSTQELTFNAPVTIAANDTITFSMNVHKDTSATEEQQKGTFVGLQGATFKLVPEPATTSLSLLGLAALMIRRRRA